MISHSNQSRGFVLMISYLAMTVLSIFSIALFSRGFIFGNAVERHLNRTVAFSAADAGIDLAIGTLAKNRDYLGSGGYTAFGTNAGYDLSVLCTDGSVPPCTGKPNPRTRLLQTSGFSPSNDNTARAYETRSIISYAEMDTTPFDYAAYAETALTLNGTPLVDSYDSRIGAYGGANIGSQGDIATNGDITLIGHPTVNGQQYSHVGAKGCGPTTVPGGVPFLGELRINGNTNHILAAGTYHFSSISVTGNAKITTLGPVTIYVDGEADLGGNGVITASNLPTNFMLYATGSGTVSIHGNSSFYGAVYAPASIVQYSGAGDFNGAVMAETYTQSGTYSLHYDIALKDVEAPCTDVSLLSWRETNTLNA